MAPLFRVLNRVHELVDQEHTTPTRLREVGAIERVRHGRRVEARSRITNNDHYFTGSVERDTALQLIEQIQARGKLPLLVGGTMLYYKALRDGLDTLPAADPAIRAALDAQAAQIGTPGMHALLMQIDPITATRLPPNDSQRIQRALEIYQLTGQPMSALLAKSAPVTLPFDLLTIALEPSDRSVLHERIATRFDAMLDPSQPNLLDEVIALRERGDLHPALPSMRCVGYRQAWDHLDGHSDFATLRATGHAATRQLAKRQLTWLRAMPDRQVIDCLDADANHKVVAAIQRTCVQ